jgi:sulfur dioxygenase
MQSAAASQFCLAAAAGGGPLLFRQLFDGETGTFTYLLVDVASRYRTGGLD